MAKKDMDALLGNILGSAIIRPQDKCEESKQESNQIEKPVNNNTPESPDAPWKHFSFICSIELANKVQAIASLLMAASMFLCSWGDDDDLIPDDNQEQVMTEWIEPCHEKNSTPDDVKAYMASSMKNHHLVNETHSTENVQLAYSTKDINVGVLYSFSTVSGSL